MCGEPLAQVVTEQAETAVPSAASTQKDTTGVMESIVKTRLSLTTLLGIITVIILVLVAVTAVWRFGSSGDTVAVATNEPVGTAVIASNNPSPTWTPLPTQTSRPTATPTITPSPQPTATLQPPRLHIVTSGETLIGLAAFYRVSVESIVAENNLAGPDAIQVNQQLLIPWPTATPPLVPVAKEVNGELVIADPTDCERYTAAEGDSLSAIAVRFDVDFDLFLEVNRIDVNYVLQPGDSLCIPRIIFGASLPPTPGPSPTPTNTPPPRGPVLLYPIDNTTVQPPDGVITLQWAAVKTLAEDELYMVELTDMDEPYPIPMRGFTRSTSFQIPANWRPDVAETHQMRWRVAIVKVTDTRSDGLPVYTYGGESSDPSFFFWEGAVPTSTPTSTPTAVPTATATPSS